jgi:ADP-ribosyl-[dinitrogen reductase] hydrolase
MTHWDPQAEVCCAVYCLWVKELLEGLSLHQAWHRALLTAFDVVEALPLAPDTPGPARLPAGFWERLAEAELRHYEELQPGGYAGYVVDCLEAAVWCCLHAAGLEEALVLAVNLAGEADTIAAVAGGAAGAAWGRNAIPARWLERLHQRERVEETARGLARLQGG